MLTFSPVLIVCSDGTQYEKTAEIVRHIGLPWAHCSSLTDARALIARQKFSSVLCNDDLPDCDLRTAVRILASSTKGVPIIVLSHLADWEAYTKAINAGASDYIAFPPDPVETERILRLALSQNVLQHKSAQTAA